ncbi:hypothetical protein EYF80_019630 [Liparis tanakae]|uniref:Uncharacterized protein n=1 Tax=Liparis tanakae TaxID=230148 RepID=A0A4Z2HX68_9TELE|nr:hypothetical protein EYF80_019630 [Liparis tanakae]
MNAYKMNVTIAKQELWGFRPGHMEESKRETMEQEVIVEMTLRRIHHRGLLFNQRSLITSEVFDRDVITTNVPKPHSSLPWEAPDSNREEPAVPRQGSGREEGRRFMPRTIPVSIKLPSTHRAEEAGNNLPADPSVLSARSV